MLDVLLLVSCKREEAFRASWPPLIPQNGNLDGRQRRVDPTTLQSAEVGGAGTGDELQAEKNRSELVLGLRIALRRKCRAVQFPLPR